MASPPFAKAYYLQRIKAALRFYVIRPAQGALWAPEKYQSDDWVVAEVYAGTGMAGFITHISSPCAEVMIGASHMQIIGVVGTLLPSAMSPWGSVVVADSCALFSETGERLSPM